MNRIERTVFGTNPTRNMNILLATLEHSTIVPMPNKYYTFVYKAKTPGITYDQYPLILCGNLFKWGFTGLNEHWGTIRQYSFPEVLSNMYEVSEEEFDLLKSVPLALFKQS